MTYFSATLLDGFSVSVNGHRLTNFPSKKAKLVLLRLLSDYPKHVSRQDLYEDIWPNLPEEKAARCLSTEIWRLKKCLPLATQGANSLQIDGGIIKFSEGVSVDSDLFEFEELLSRISDIEQTNFNCISKTIGNLTTNSNILAPCCDSHWLILKRQQIHMAAQKAIGAFLNQTIDSEISGSMDQIWLLIDCAKWLLDTDPLQDSVHLHLMKLYLQQGKRDLALSQYSQCRRYLSEELGISPSIEVEVFYKQLIDSEQNNFAYKNHSIKSSSAVFETSIKKATAISSDLHKLLLTINH